MEMSALQVMRVALWLCACLAAAGLLGRAACMRHLLDTPQSSGSPSPTVPDLAQITNPKPAILYYPNAPGYAPDMAPDPAFMDLPSYAPSPGDIL